MILGQKSRIKTTVWDIMDAGPARLFLMENGLTVILDFEDRLRPSDSLLLFFFFRDEIWLIEQGMFNHACIGMFVVLEDRLKKELMKLVTSGAKIEKTPIEEMNLNELINDLEESLPPKTVKTLRTINTLRKAFVHTNMKKGRELIEKDKGRFARSLDIWRGEDAVQKHEAIRISFKMYTHKFCTRLLLLCLIVLRELERETLLKKPSSDFDKLVQDAIKQNLLEKYRSNELHKYAKKSRGEIERMWKKIVEKKIRKKHHHAKP